jgi:hypothetical protein
VSLNSTIQIMYGGHSLFSDIRMRIVRSKWTPKCRLPRMVLLQEYFVDPPQSTYATGTRPMVPLNATVIQSLGGSSIREHRKGDVTIRTSVGSCDYRASHDPRVEGPATTGTCLSNTHNALDISPKQSPFGQTEPSPTFAEAREEKKIENFWCAHAALHFFLRQARLCLENGGVGGRGMPTTGPVTIGFRRPLPNLIPKEGSSLKEEKK